jgi:Fe-S cluster assembly protein SufD
MNAGLRVIKTPAEQGLAEAYLAAKPRLPGTGRLAALREDAFRRFEAQGLPHRRVEEWKYTDLRALVPEALPLAAVPDAAAKTKAATAGFSGIEGRRLVFVDGVFVPELSDLSAEGGLTLGSLADALAKADPAVTAHIGKVFDTNDIAVALNTALMGDGAVIRVAAGTKLTRPIVLMFAATQAAAVFTRSLVVIEKGAQASLVEIHQSGPAQVNNAVELLVEDGAQVDHVKITDAQGLHLSSLMALVGRNVKLNTFNFTAGSTLVRNQMFLRFAGKHTEASIGGVSLLSGKQHVDSTLLIQHAAENCVSRERFRSVLDGTSRAVFQGKIIVEPGAQKTDAKMVSNALLLSDEAEADNKPELEIFADDVQCGHGATAGALDEALLFYLRARGIPRKEAEALLIQAFVGEIIEGVANEKLREALLDAAVAWLKARG